MKNLQKAAPELRNGYKDRKRLAAVAMLGCCVCQKFNLKQWTRSEVHHLIGCGLGKKASDLKTINLCSFHHTSGGNGEAIHKTPLWIWQQKFGTQEEFLQETDNKLK